MVRFKLFWLVDRISCYELRWSHLIKIHSDHKLKTTEISTWIEVTVTANNETSAEIFGDCIDAIDNLIQEWYPALTENFFPIIFYFAAYFIQEHLGLSLNYGSYSTGWLFATSEGAKERYKSVGLNSNKYSSRLTHCWNHVVINLMLLTAKKTMTRTVFKLTWFYIGQSISLIGKVPIEILPGKHHIT